jgi:hypothetical protein
MPHREVLYFPALECEQGRDQGISLDFRDAKISGR